MRGVVSSIAVLGALALAAARPAGAQPATRTVATATRTAATATAAKATAETDDVIGLLDVRVEGLSADATAVFTRKIEEGLEMSGLKVASRERLRAYLAGTPWNSACLLGACLSELARGAEVATVIEVALATSGPSYHYVITLLDTRTGHAINQVAAKCDVCTTDEAFAEASLAVVAVVNGVGDGAAPIATAAPDPQLRRTRARVMHARSRARTLGITLIGLAAVAAGGAYYFFEDDRDTLGGASAGAAGALGVAGFTSLGLSFSF